MRSQRGGKNLQQNSSKSIFLVMLITCHHECMSKVHLPSNYASLVLYFFYLTDHFFCRQIVSAAGKNNRNNWNFYFFAVLFPFFLCIFFFCRFFANFPATDIRNKKAWLANFFYFIYSRVSEFCENVFFFAKFWIALKFIQISFYRPRTVSLDA